MDFGISIETDGTVPDASKFAKDLERYLAGEFLKQEFGKGVESVTIGLILYRTDSDRFHAERPLRFTKTKTFRNPAKGTVEVWNNFVEFDVKLRSFDGDIGVNIVNGILCRIDALKPALKKVQNFDADGFLESLRAATSRFLAAESRA